MGGVNPIPVTCVNVGVVEQVVRGAWVVCDIEESEREGEG